MNGMARVLGGTAAAVFGLVLGVLLTRGASPSPVTELTFETVKKSTTVGGISINPQSAWLYGGTLEAAASYAADSAGATSFPSGLSKGQRFVVKKTDDSTLAEYQVVDVVKNPADASDLSFQLVDLREVRNNTVTKANPCALQPYETASPRPGSGEAAAILSGQFQAKALFVPGYWLRTGQPGAGEFLALGTPGNTQGRFMVSCMTGVSAKCAQWGYLPWKADKLEYWTACVGAARADYLGSGQSATSQGSIINLWDNHGTVTPNPSQYVAVAKCTTPPPEPKWAPLEEGLGLEAIWTAKQGTMGLLPTALCRNFARWGDQVQPNMWSCDNGAVGPKPCGTDPTPFLKTGPWNTWSGTLVATMAHRHPGDCPPQ